MHLKWWHSGNNVPVMVILCPYTSNVTLFRSSLVETLDASTAGNTQDIDICFHAQNFSLTTTKAEILKTTLFLVTIHPKLVYHDCAVITNRGQGFRHPDSGPTLVPTSNMLAAAGSSPAAAPQNPIAASTAPMASERALSAPVSGIVVCPAPSARLQPW